MSIDPNSTDPKELNPVIAAVPKRTLMANRLTANVSVVYEVPGSDPIAMRSTFVRAFDTCEEEPYSRKIEVGPNWKAVDLGWTSAFRNFVVLECLRTADFNVLVPGIQQPPIEVRCAKVAQQDDPAEFLLLSGMSLPVLLASQEMKLFVRCTEKVKMHVRSYPANSTVTDESTEIDTNAAE